MRKIIVIAALCIGMYGCDNKKDETVQKPHSDEIIAFGVKRSDTVKTISESVYLERTDNQEYTSKSIIKPIEILSNADYTYLFNDDNEICEVKATAQFGAVDGSNVFKNIGNILVSKYGSSEVEQSIAFNYQSWSVGGKRGGFIFLSNEPKKGTVRLSYKFNNANCDTREDEQKKIGKWQKSFDKDPINDKEFYIAGISASSGVNTYGEYPSLVIRCRDKQVDLLIDWKTYISNERKEVAFRLGKEKAETNDWNISANGKATFYPDNAIGAVKKILVNDTLVARVTPYNASAITAIFDIKGAGYALKDIVKACSIVTENNNISAFNIKKGEYNFESLSKVLNLKLNNTYKGLDTYVSISLPKSGGDLAVFNHYSFTFSKDGVLHSISGYEEGVPSKEINLINAKIEPYLNELGKPDTIIDDVDSLKLKAKAWEIKNTNGVKQIYFSRGLNKKDNIQLRYTFDN